jgi:hypothetical protein
VRRRAALALAGCLCLGMGPDARTFAHEPEAAQVSSRSRQSTIPLFESDTAITLTIEAPFRSMLDERDASSEFPARLAYRARGGDSVQISLTVRARGKSRLRGGICNFPGLMLVFPDSSAEGTLFADQDQLPVVAVCDIRREQFEQYVLLEYLAYRTFRVLAPDLALRVRLARIEYVDNERNRSLGTSYGFFLENWYALAARTGWRVLETPQVPPDEYSLQDRNRMSVFQFLIGNTDWSMVSAAPDENNCCHNAVPVGDYRGPIFPVPYDFDQAGLVNAPYATPNPNLGIRNVRQRRYRGVCIAEDQLEATLTHFRDRAEAIYREFRETPGLARRTRADAISYVDDFYAVINDRSRLNRELVQRCR